MFDTHCITAGSETLLQQAAMTAHDYMLKAIRDIDELLGKDYAKQHPELIAAYIQTAAIRHGDNRARDSRASQPSTMSRS